MKTTADHPLGSTVQIKFAPASASVRRVRGGFTLIELILVVVIIGILAAMIFPALSLGRERAKRAVCVSNERQQMLSLNVYASENKDYLPNNSAPPGLDRPSWAWDMPRSCQSVVAGSGATRNVWYDPGAPQMLNDEGFQKLWTYGWSDPFPYGVVGYAMTFKGTLSYADSAPQGTDAAGNLATWYFATNQNPKLSTRSVQLFATTLPVDPTQRPLTACATITPDGASAFMQKKLGYNWASIPDGTNLTFSSPHMEGPAVPEGGNVGMLDGHVEWRSFAQLIPRAGGNGDPFFYY